MNNQKEPENPHSVANQIKGLMEQSPQSLENIQYGEIIIRVRKGKCVLMNVNHAFKIDEIPGDSNGDDKTQQRDSGL